MPPVEPILALLAEMQRAFVHMAIVKHEHGISQGLVTPENIRGELVGEIRDEYDREELQSIQRRDEDYVSFGRVKVLDFNGATGWKIPAEPTE
jgi:CBS domain containing-hemolysin-like protein